MTAAAIACGALLQRDLRAFLRSRSQLYSSVLLPLMLLVILGTGVSDGLHPSSAIIRDGDYVSFLVPGMIALTALFSSTFSSASFYRDRDSGMLRTFLASPHGPRTILLGKSLAAVTIGSVQALIILLVALVPSIDFSWQYGRLGGLGRAGALARRARRACAGGVSRGHRCTPRRHAGRVGSGLFDRARSRARVRA